MLSPRRRTGRALRAALFALAAVLIGSVAPIAAQPLQYEFSHGAGEPTDMTDATVLLIDVAWYDDVTTGMQEIGFPFVFQGVSYTEFSANSNGMLKLGPVEVGYDYYNELSNAGDNYPLLVNWWDDLVLDGDPVGVNGGDAGMSMKVTGAPGSRVLTVEWRARPFGYSEPPTEEGEEGAGELGEIPFTFQARLYEGTNVIEYVYVGMSTLYPTSGSIGIATATDNFMSVTPGMGSPLSGPTVSRFVANDTINLMADENRLPAGTIYRFTPFASVSFTSNGVGIAPGSALFTLMQNCVGGAVSVPLTVWNTGVFDVELDALDIFAVDSTDVQGSLLLARDGAGRPIPSSDYVVSDSPGVAPIGANVPASFPTTLAPGEQRTYYVTFVGGYPGRRLARLFLRTNSTTFASADTTNVSPAEMTPGLLAVDLVAQAIGSGLARDLSGRRLRTVVFADTRAGDTTIQTYTIVNSGACDLRINRRRLRIFSGDVNEYRLLSVLPGVPVDATSDDYVIAPGDSGTLTIAFMPVRSGTRLATIFMQTNDSTLGIAGITERGSYYLDLHGRGRAGLDARDLTLRPVVIGGFTNGIVELENTSITSVDIASISFSGLDSADFTADAIAAWPALPARIIPGQKLLLGVRLTPEAGSSAGARRTTMVVVTTTGDTIRIVIRSEAGTQSLVVSPTSIFDDVTIVAGASARRTVMIANTGTLPVRLTSVVITGADAANYRMGPLPRMDLEPGQTEFLEITFAPQTVGQSTAQLEVSSNAGPTQVVQLGGTSLRIRRDPIDPTRIAPPGTGDPTPELLEHPTLR
ncbi:MAG TPA: choice-of-anchor D domain-containing protein [Candidatus Kapabacteria bacterium]|nr:choice-of-anchor D domain-containing protein [Candidatus Kapabacteria bacterium]